MWLAAAPKRWTAIGTGLLAMQCHGYLVPVSARSRCSQNRNNICQWKKLLAELLGWSCLCVMADFAWEAVCERWQCVDRSLSSHVGVAVSTAAAPGLIALSWFGAMLGTNSWTMTTMGNSLRPGAGKFVLIGLEVSRLSALLLFLPACFTATWRNSTFMASIFHPPNRIRGLCWAEN